MGDPTVISLFSGAGGLDLGFEAAGFDVVCAVDSNRDACDTLSAHYGASVPVYHMPVADVPSWPSADVVIGGPPCQPFSKMMDWVGGGAGMTDPRAQSLVDFFDVVETVKPEVFVLENVPTFLSKGGEEFCRLAGERLGYSVVSNVFTASTYGAPQKRRRAFVVGTLGGTPLDLDVKDKAKRTPWDALSEIEPSPEELEAAQASGKWAGLLPSVPPGKNYLHFTSVGPLGLEMFVPRRPFWNFLLRSSPTKPVVTITASPGPATGPFHWDARRFTLSELAALQTFPTGHPFKGTPNSQARQIGNAVPPLLGEVVGRAVGRSVFGKVYPDPPVHRPPTATTPPPVASVHPVPEEYLP